MAFKSLSKSEKAYIQTSLQAQSPLRGDGRSLHEFRAVTLQTGIVSIANGSAHINLGRSFDENRQRRHGRGQNRVHSIMVRFFSLLNPTRKET